MRLRDFIKSKDFFKHLLLIIASFLVLIFIVSLLLKVYTRHGKEYDVPKIVGRNISEIENSEDLKYFDIMVMDSIYKEGVSFGTILSQDPSPGNKVKKGRKIYITIASQSGEMTRMPACRDRSIKSAVQALVDAGLRVGTIMYRVGDVNGVVIDQRYMGKTIGTGQDIQSGESVDLIVEVTSTTATTHMPDIISKTESDAEILLWKAGLNVGKKVFEGKQDDSHTRVVSYSPKLRNVTIGTAIDMTLINDTERAYRRQMEEFKSQSEETGTINVDDTINMEHLNI